MRFYRIALTNLATGAAVLPASLRKLGITSLLPNGQVNPAALNIELDIPVFPFHAPDGNGLVRIWGLGLAAVGNAFNLNGVGIAVFAGMSKGLPLANPKQAGVLVQGQIYQAFGNWIGTDQTIDLLLAPATGTTAAPINLVLNWQANTPLAPALTGALQTAFPNAKVVVNVSPRLVQTHDASGHYPTLEALASLLMPLSHSIVTDANYAGVSITYDGVTVTATDQTGPAPTPVAIVPQDLVGQPTWKEPGVISVKTVMRSDIAINDLVTLPPTLITNNAGAFTSLQGAAQNTLTFSGKFLVLRVHHYGNFRQPSADAWNTTLDLTPQTS